MSNLELDFGSSEAKRPRGFRLHRLELLNWGTFHRQVHVLSPEGGWTLLVGENGSGKSTAVDALRTLLVPPRLLQYSYNDASGERKRQDRNRRSYVRGAWASASQEDSSRAMTQYLRGEREYSILLAVFKDEAKEAAVTLAQILWDLGEKLDEVFCVARADRNICEHLSNLGESREIRKTLRARGFEAFDSFTGYSERFCKLLRIPGEAALEVFNQAIGVKEVADVNQFVRRHMLEAPDAIEFIQKTLRPHFTELDQCWLAIQKAEKQLKDLAPIVACHRRIEQASAEKEAWERLLDAAGPYYAARQLSLRTEEAKRLEERLERLRRQAEELELAQQQDGQTRETLQAELNGGETGLAIQRLKLDKETAELALRRKQTQRESFEAGLKLLEERTPATEEEFQASRGRWESSRGLIEGNRVSSEQKMFDQKMEQQRALQDRQRWLDELEMLRQRRVLIPREHQQIRDALCAAAGIAPEDLPFAGELMEVNPEFAEWTGAIERLLRSFALSMAVPEQCYPAVARWINQKHLGLRFVFHRVPAMALGSGEAAEQAVETGRVPGRMNFRAEHPMHRWVAAELRRGFRHVCCEDAAQLQRETFGLTREGLIRDGATRHIKDDRHAVGDVSNYVLGWSAENKIRALTQKLSAAEGQARQAGERARQAQAQLRKWTEQLQALETVLRVEAFAEVDAAPEQRRISGLAHQIEQLESGSEERKRLKVQIERIQNQIAGRHRELLALARDKGVDENALARNTEAMANLRGTLQAFPGFDPEPFKPAFYELQEGQALTLENVGDAHRNAAKRLQGRINHQSALLNRETQEMLPLMARFLNENGEETLEMQARVECGGQFASLQARLEREELPKHKQRFEQFLSTNLIGDMAMFRSKLEQHQRDIQARIQHVNAALKRIPFSKETFVQIAPSPARTEEIRSFRAGLKDCLSGGLTPSEEDRMRIFENIRGLLEKFEREMDWTRRVTDARNWLEFGVRELRHADQGEVNYFTASSGKSGGQKAKLAFTILASAITAQYGLTGEEADADAFRLVVIDEAFARTDEENSEQALKLFHHLGLQLMVVSPFDAKARIVENYVDSFHLTVNPERNNSRIKRASRAEYEAERGDRES